MSSVTASDAVDDDDDDDDGTATARHYNDGAPHFHAYDGRNPSSGNSNAGRKSHVVSRNSSRHRENPTSSQVPVHHPVRRGSASRGNPASRRENPASRENRGAKLSAKQSKCCDDGRSPLGTIGQRSNLLIVGQHALPPVPSEYLRHPRGYLNNI